MIGEKAVTEIKIKDGSINVDFGELSGSSLKDNSVGTSDLGAETVSSSEIDEEAVVTESLKERNKQKT